MANKLNYLRRRVIDMAERNKALLDGTVGPVKRIIDESELVFGVWLDVGEPQGMGILVIKGVHRLEAITAGGSSQNGDGVIAFPAIRELSIGAVPCISAEQA